MEFKEDIDNSCGFHIKDNGPFCTPPQITNKLKDFVLNFIEPGVQKNERTIFKVLKEKYNCNSAVCILNQNDVKKYITPGVVNKVIEENFKPAGPRDNFNWLSNNDIDEVLNQISKKYEDKKFKHIHFQMIDFEKTGGDLARLDWPAEYARGYRTFGTVINTDISTGGGIHWFAIFGDFLDENDVYTIEYFNSSGELPPDEIILWLKRVKHEWDFEKPIKDVVVTRIVNQRDGHSCGPYSLYYIISRLDGVPYSYFSNNKIGDKNMHLFRKYLFRDEN